MTRDEPWAILICRYSDDANDPATTTIAQLAAQWKATKDGVFLAANLNPTWDTDHRTILQLCEGFFTTIGLFTFNSVRYWDENSHGAISTANSRVFSIKLNRTIAEHLARVALIDGVNVTGRDYEDETIALASSAA